MKRRLIRRIALLVGLFSMTGIAIGLSNCVFPTNFYSGHCRHNLNEKTASLLKTGETTKEEVFLMLGEPDYVSVVDKVIGFQWEKVRVVYFLFSLGGGVGGTFDKKFELRIRFDDDDRVEEIYFTEGWSGSFGKF